MKRGERPFRIERTDEPLVAQGGLMLAYEMTKALKMPQVVDHEMPAPGSGHNYRPTSTPGAARAAQKPPAPVLETCPPTVKPAGGMVFSLGHPHRYFWVLDRGDVWAREAPIVAP